MEALLSIALQDILVWILVPLLYLLGVGAGIHAILYGRTSQGTVAWIMGLIAFPLISLPLYVLFGRKRFIGYVNARREGDSDIHHHGEMLKNDLAPFAAELTGFDTDLESLEKLARLPFSGSNRCRLLIDGPETFDAIFEAIDAAEHYILVQFFIVRSTGVGEELKARLIEKAGQGVRVYFLYDALGSRSTRRSYWRELRRAGVEVTAFNATRAWNAFHLNFRNHRKIVLVDGKVAFMGGHNVGEEYMGRSRRFGPWRDTHVRIEGPAVQCAQLTFLEDWYWATSRLPDIDARPSPAPGGNQQVLVMATGPADRLDTCNLMFCHAVSLARERFWLVSPYFVPGPELVSELKLAALRGVDVRILLPNRPDHKMVWFASFSYLEELNLPGIQFFRYQPGFLHQKAMLIDREAAAVGTANADNRSIHLNFELTLFFADRAFTGEVERMMERDFENSTPVGIDEYRNRGLAFVAMVRLCRLLSPVL